MTLVYWIYTIAIAALVMLLAAAANDADVFRRMPAVPPTEPIAPKPPQRLTTAALERDLAKIVTPLLDKKRK